MGGLDLVQGQFLKFSLQAKNVISGWPEAEFGLKYAAWVSLKVKYEVNVHEWPA